MQNFLSRFCPLLLLFVIVITTVAEDRASEKSKEVRNTDKLSPRRVIQKNLESLNLLIGTWRGTGQLRRGSSQGAWQEKSSFVWKYGQETAAIQFTTQDSRYFAEASLTWDPKEQQYLLNAVLLDQSTRTYTGSFQNRVLQLESAPDHNGIIHRLILRILNDQRILIIHEQRKQTQSATTRLCEIGYTRDEVRLAAAGQAGPECVVSGGAGTIKVSYKGTVWHVCCAGCRDAFDADPERIIDEYKNRRLKAEQ